MKKPKKPKLRYVVDLESDVEGLPGKHVTVVDTTGGGDPPTAVACCGLNSGSHFRGRPSDYAVRICAYLNLLDAEGRAP